MDTSVIPAGQTAVVEPRHDHGDRRECEVVEKVAKEILVRDAEHTSQVLVEVLKASKEDALRAQAEVARLAEKAAERHGELKELIRLEAEKGRAQLERHELKHAEERAAKAEAVLASYFARNMVPVLP